MTVVEVTDTAPAFSAPPVGHALMPSDQPELRVLHSWLNRLARDRA